MTAPRIDLDTPSHRGAIAIIGQGEAAGAVAAHIAAHDPDTCTALHAAVRWAERADHHRGCPAGIPAAVGPRRSSDCICGRAAALAPFTDQP